MVQETYRGVYLPFGADYGDRRGRDLWTERVGVVTEDIESFRFGGLRRSELVDVIVWVADKIGIKDTEVPNIEVIFGEDCQQTHARTYMFFDQNSENQGVLGCSVVINRAREVVEPVISTLRENMKAGEVAIFRDGVHMVEEVERMVP